MNSSLYKNQSRCSENNRPEINSFVIFSKVITAILNHLVPRPDEKNGLFGKVISISAHLVEVKFDTRPSSDLVHPEFLITCSLSKEGKRIYSLLNEEKRERITKE